MGTRRTTAAVGVLVVEAGLAVLGVVLHHGFTAMYGDVTDLAVDSWRAEFSSGLGGMALGLVVVTALVTVVVSTQRWVRLAAVAVPVLMVGGLLAVTPAALREKLSSQYDDTPQCLSTDLVEPGPGAAAERESQQVFESIEHVGHFSGGGGSGVGGCDRPFVVIEDVHVLEHYRVALPRAGWRVVEDGRHRIRAEREGMAFEVTVCGRGGVVWAGRADVRGTARCASATGA